MHSFTVTGVGNLADDPERTVEGDKACTRLCLIGNDRAGRDAPSSHRERVTSIRFVAFDSLAETFAGNARQGDQLVLQAQIRASHWTDKNGAVQHDLTFVKQSFRFGASGRLKQAEMAEREAAEMLAASPF